MSTSCQEVLRHLFGIFKDLLKMNLIKYTKEILSKHLTRLKPKYLSTSQQQVGKPMPQKYTWMLIIPVTAFGLGTWQVRRLQWKQGLIKDLEKRTQAEPVPLNLVDMLSPEKIQAMEYHRVTMCGHYDHSKEILLGPRTENKHKPSSGGGLIAHGQSNVGFHIVTPFVLDTGARILVNRGWVSKDTTDPEKRLDGQITDRIKVSGLVRKGEKRPRFTPQIKDGDHSWHYCDVDSFSRILDTLPVLIDADSASNVHGGPISGQTRVTLRNEHMQYIITWYSLCAATLVLYYQLRKKPASMFKGPVFKD